MRISRRSERPAPRSRVAKTPKGRFSNGFDTYPWRVKDQGGAEKLIWLDPRARSAARAAGSQWTDDGDTGLTRRVDELEQKVAAILADLIPEASRPPSPEPDRRSLADEIAELRKVREDIQEGLANLRRGGPELRSNEVRAEPSSDVHSAVAGEMRALLAELFADFRARAAPLLAEQPLITTARAPLASQPTVEDVKTTPAALGAATIDEPSTGTMPPAQPSAIASPPLPLGPTVEDVESVPAPVDSVRVAELLTESVESVIEHVDELVRPSANGPVEDEYVEDLSAAEDVAPTDALDLTAAASEPVAPIFDDSIEGLPIGEAVAPADVLEVEAALAEPAPTIADTRVFERLEPASIVREDVEDFVRPEAPPIEASDLSAAPAEPVVDVPFAEVGEPESPPSPQALEPIEAPTEPFEAIVPEYVEDVDPLGLVEPVAPQFAAPAELIIETPVTPPVVRSTPDPRIAALWDSASLPTEAEAAPLSQVEPASFITEESVAATRPMEIPEAPPEPLPEFAPEQTIEFAPPPVEFAPRPPVEYTPEPPAISEPAPVAYSPPTEADMPIWASPFPELRVADDRGLHQIQIVISPIHSFPRLLDTEARIRALSTVNAVHLRDFRNGVATFAVAVSEAISPAEFGAVIQMLQDLHLRLEGTTQTTVELRAEDDLATS